MKPSEIKAQVDAGTLSIAEASKMFQDMHSNNQPSVEVVTPERTIATYQPPVNRIFPEPGDMLSAIQVSDRAELAEVRRQLAMEIESRSTQHEFQRAFVEETARHWLATFAVAFIGVADGALEAGVYGISEIAETITYGITRTAKRLWQGVSRGWNS